MIGDENTP